MRPLVAALLSALAAPLLGQTPQAPVAHCAVGVLGQFGDRTWCLSAPDSTLRRGARIPTATVPLRGDTTPPSLATVEILGRLPSHQSCDWAGYGDSYYQARVVSGQPAGYRGGINVALLRAGATFKVQSSTVRADVLGDGRLLTFRACTSNEGIHLTLWAGSPLRSRRLWHRYDPLGYDTEPSCRPADYAEK